MNCKTSNKRPNQRHYLKSPTAFANSLSPGFSMYLPGLGNSSSIRNLLVRLNSDPPEERNPLQSKEGRRHIPRPPSWDTKIRLVIRLIRSVKSQVLVQPVWNAAVDGKLELLPLNLLAPQQVRDCPGARTAHAST